MKKLVISGSSKLYERALYWRGYFEGRGYNVIDWPRPLFEEEDLLAETQPEPGLPLGRIIRAGDPTFADGMIKFHQQFYKHLDQTDVLFVMNEDKNGIEGYIGANTFAEVQYSVINNINRGRKTEINLLKTPSKTLSCYDEIKFWLDQGQIKIYHRPTGKKATIPVPDDDESEDKAPLTVASNTDQADITEDSTPVAENKAIDAPIAKTSLFNRDNRMFDITTCNKRCLSSLTPEVREYLKVLSPEFPAWLLRYIAAPEMQRLTGISMTCGLDYGSLYTYKHFFSVFEHSIGVAFIIWHFTHDKKQTLAGLFHDIATPAFKHSIDFMNGDAETQESTEERTAQIIRDSRVIMKNLKKDGILASEVSDYHLYPIADNDLPNLSADRLEYTLSNGLKLYDIWDLDKVKTFYRDLTVLKNENDADEIAFQTPEIASDFTKLNIPLATIYHSDKSRANMQFLADIVQSMINGGYLTIDDLYVMSEREVIDWILSCGDKTLSEAFRNFQRATSVFSSGVSKKNCYCASVKAKVRYIVPLTKKDGSVKRVTAIDKEAKRLVEEYLDTKQSKYVGFDFDFQPYTE